MSPLARFLAGLVLVAALAGVFRAAGPRGDFPRAIASAHIENLFQLSERVYAGGQPSGDDAFAQLRELGVATVLSVDGGRPEVERARQHGLTYMHVPIGYHGIDEPQLLQIVKAAQSAEGPIFIHCHHGKHRGPAAAAIVCRATEGWQGDRAAAWLVAAGTSPKYRGLFRDVEQFAMPSAEALRQTSEQIPETAETPGLVRRMVAISEHWETLQGTTAASKRDSVDLAHEALLLGEQLRELQREESTAEHDAEYAMLMQQAEAGAMDLHAALSATTTEPSGVAELMTSVRQKCAACHERFRD